ncbi:hypothetical protein F2Q69_00032850 [Brassica cretica]|uniref:PPIase cyclophilin-type domain-containing protein n=1 Tax=Brassica cretica TaxID=69181 RepID=A0A8S9SL37_BRACR|nr:hypothetical protein F2Q69_00032850 [Brassica cretica]
MRREISFLLQPRCLLLLVALTIFLIFALFNTGKEEEKQVIQDFETTHRVFLDVDIDGQRLGVVAMANTGPDSNGSQFFITTVKASWLEGEHVVFGKVIQGMDNVFAIEGGAGTYSGKPRKKVVIADSGEIPKDKWDEER